MWFYSESWGRMWWCPLHTVASHREPLPFSSLTPVQVSPGKVKMPNHTATCAPVSGFSSRQTVLTALSDQLHVMWTFSLESAGEETCVACCARACRLLCCWCCAVCPLPCSMPHFFFLHGWIGIIPCINYTVVDYMCGLVFGILHSVFPHNQLWFGVGSAGRLMRDVFTDHVLPDSI